ADKGYYKQKGVVRKVIDKYVGEIEMIKSKHKLRVDQEELETVIPQIGGVVRVVNGAYCGSNARLLSVNTDKFCGKVQIEKGVYLSKQPLLRRCPPVGFEWNGALADANRSSPLPRIEDCCAPQLKYILFGKFALTMDE
nr:KIN17-like protein [Tanacetum cinerariifolium]